MLNKEYFIYISKLLLISIWIKIQIDNNTKFDDNKLNFKVNYIN